MDLLFNTFEFRGGVNVTVRNGDKWLVPAGTLLELKETGCDEVLDRGRLILSVKVRFDEIPQAWLDLEHAEEAHTTAGLVAAMDRAYGVGQWGPEVVVVFFEMDNPIPQQVRNDLRLERIYQLSKGRVGKLPGPDEGWTYEYDDANSVNDWASHIIRYLGRTTSPGVDSPPGIADRESLVKVACLAIAEIEAIDRAEARRQLKLATSDVSSAAT